MSCLFCLVADGVAEDLPENQIIEQSEHFYAKAALGHFVSGYTLIIPKDHWICFTEVPFQLFRELDEFILRVRRKVELITGKEVMIFEHGPMNRLDSAGACIEHAHLHLLPVSNDLLKPLGDQFEFERLDSRAQLTEYCGRKNQYVYLETPAGIHYFAQLAGTLPTQFIRRVACSSLGIPDLWDWRKSPLREKLNLFVRSYRERIG
jgi:diadenosine tetraphosphate (Ap4A) HIT family hydrolase